MGIHKLRRWRILVGVRCKQRLKWCWYSDCGLYGCLQQGSWVALQEHFCKLYVMQLAYCFGHDVCNTCSVLMIAIRWYCCGYDSGSWKTHFVEAVRVGPISFHPLMSRMKIRTNGVAALKDFVVATMDTSYTTSCSVMFLVLCTPTQFRDWCQSFPFWAFVFSWPWHSNDSRCANAQDNQQC